MLVLWSFDVLSRIHEEVSFFPNLLAPPLPYKSVQTRRERFLLVCHCFNCLSFGSIGAWCLQVLDLSGLFLTGFLLCVCGKRWSQVAMDLHLEKSLKGSGLDMGDMEDRLLPSQQVPPTPPPPAPHHSCNPREGKSPYSVAPVPLQELPERCWSQQWTALGIPALDFSWGYTPKAFPETGYGCKAEVWNQVFSFP